jgi:hypothetical protein
MFAVATDGPRLNQDTVQPRCPSGSVSLGLVFDIIAGRHDFELEKRQYPWAEELPSYMTIKLFWFKGATPAISVPVLVCF